MSTYTCTHRQALQQPTSLLPPLPPRSYISHVTFDPGNSIRSRVGSSALFHHLNNTWEFAPGPRPGTTALTFYVDFAFKSALYSEVTNIFFDQVVSRMMAALEGRCREVYGPPNES